MCLSVASALPRPGQVLLVELRLRKRDVFCWGSKDFVLFEPPALRLLSGLGSLRAQQEE